MRVAIFAGESKKKKSHWYSKDVLQLRFSPVWGGEMIKIFFQSKDGVFVHQRRLLFFFGGKKRGEFEKEGSRGGAWGGGAYLLHHNSLQTRFYSYFHAFGMQ